MAMGKTLEPGLGKSAARLLADLAGGTTGKRGKPASRANANDVALLVSADLATREPGGDLAVTAAGRAHLARAGFAQNRAQIDPFFAQHLALARRGIETPAGQAEVAIDDAESPLVWLARRKGRDGRALIEPVQLQAGERLRAEFTHAQMMPRVTSNWSAAIAQGRRSSGGTPTFTETAVAAQQSVRRALNAVGPEFAGLLLDVCCFLKGLEDIERERTWPPRSAKIVLQLALDRLARHYGFSAEIRGYAQASIRTWLAPDAVFDAGD
jgi:hypothetical protein